MSHFNMINSEQMQIRQQHNRYIHQGNIYKVCGSYYSNPQIYFFIATFVLSISLIIMLMRYVFITSPHFYIGLFLCSYFLYRFLSLAFSDPGLARNRDNGGEQQNVNFCQTCVLPMRRRTFHCQICDVCVDGYDHHCIFVGKCIGRGNMGQFKQFLFIVFGTMIYALIISVQIKAKIENK